MSKFSHTRLIKKKKKESRIGSKVIVSQNTKEWTGKNVVIHIKRQIPKRNFKVYPFIKGQMNGEPEISNST